MVPSSAVSFLGEGSPAKIDYRKNGTLILASLLENLAFFALRVSAWTLLCSFESRIQYTYVFRPASQLSRFAFAVALSWCLHVCLLDLWGKKIAS